VTGPQQLYHFTLIFLSSLFFPHFARVRAALRYSKARVGGLLDPLRVLLFKFSEYCNNTMTTTLPSPAWVLQKAVLVYTPDFNVSCLARLRIAHDKAANQGSISLRITADLANLSGRSQVLTLNVPPSVVENCALARKSNDDLCPSGLVYMLPASETDVSAVSTLSLRLSTTGIVLCPSEMESLIPANQGDLHFHAFAKICQSKFLRLHFARRQFVNKELDRLETFSCALRKASLQSESFDHARHGVV
jgi:hypothetical protein